MVDMQVYIPTSNIQGFPFLHILADMLFTSFCWYPSWQVWGNISLWFWIAFPWWLVMLSIFSHAICMWKDAYSGLLLYFLKLFLFFWCWVSLTVYICWILTSNGSCHLQIFSLIQRLSFHFLNGFLWHAKMFKFN